MTDRFQEDVVQKAMRDFIPLTAHLSITEQCDLDCSHCYLPSRRSRHRLTLHETRDLLVQLREAGTLFVILSGGECLLHPDFFEMARAVRDTGLALRVYSNGNNIDHDKASRIAGLHPVSVDISLYGSTAEGHESITRVKGSFGRTVRAIRDLTDMGVRVHVKTPIMKQNMADLQGIKGLAKDMGAELRESPYIFGPGGDDRSCESIRCNAGDMKTMLSILDGWRPDGAARVQAEKKAALSREERYRQRTCGAGCSYVSIDCNGDVLPCPMFRDSAGNVRQARFNDIWRDAPMFQELRTVRVGDLPECRDCDSYPWCSRCVASVHSSTGGFLMPDEQACELAHARKNLIQPPK